MNVLYPPVHDVWFLTGPTASGKSQVGVELARLIDAEIISMDSMAVYPGMDIGTAKPTPEQRAAVPHHLIDVVAATQDFSVAEYLDAAHRQVAEIKTRGRQVLFVGGTPLYLKALLCGMSSGPDADWELRRALEAEAESHGARHLYQRLKEVDPQAAAKVHPHDTRRLVRALEVFEKTGQGISTAQTHFGQPPSDDAQRLFVLDWPRPVLHERINTRVEAMFAAGLVGEVERLWTDHGQLGRTASQAVGYREAVSVVRGDLGLAAAIERTQAGTRQLARRQLIWFRGLAACHWISMSEPLDAKRIGREIIGRAG